MSPAACSCSRCVLNSVDTQTHESPPLSVLRHYAILLLILVAVLSAAWAFADSAGLFIRFLCGGIID